jgi:membrane protease YdiL (CAAX protease family)
MISAEFEGTGPAMQRLEAFRLESLGLKDDSSTIDETIDTPDTISGSDPDTSSGSDPVDANTTISVSTNDLILQELDILRTLYTEGPEALDEDQTAQLKTRYGYIGHVALTHGKPSSNPERKALTDQFMSLALFLILVALVVLLGPLVGIVLLILGMVWFFGGKMKMRARVPTPGGSVYLETYALFVGGFCLMAVGTFVISNSNYPEFAAFSLLVQWLLLLTVFWGLLRGAKGSEWRQAIGWHTGEGLFKEIGCGIVGYLASVPIYIVGVIITAIILITKEMIQTNLNNGVPPEPEPMVNPVFDMIARGDLFILVFLFALATTWAPIVEELIFRGALYRHLRGRMHWVFSALLTAVLFAFMHDYGPLMVAPLIALGFSFAFMREWRGSIIAPMTAHFIHNFTLMSFMIILVQVIKDPPM